MFKPGDLVKVKGTRGPVFILSGVTSGRWWWFLNSDGGGAYESQLERIQEEPMTHPYLTPEKIGTLAEAISESFGYCEERKMFEAVKAVLEREANPPKTRSFHVTFRNSRTPYLPTQDEVVTELRRLRTSELEVREVPE